MAKVKVCIKVSDIWPLTLNGDLDLIMWPLKNVWLDKMYMHTKYEMYIC